MVCGGFQIKGPHQWPIVGVAPASLDACSSIVRIYVYIYIHTYTCFCIYLFISSLI